MMTADCLGSGLLTVGYRAESAADAVATRGSKRAESDGEQRLGHCAEVVETRNALAVNALLGTNGYARRN